MSELVARAEPSAVRLALLDQHYRKDWEWHEDLLSQAQSRLSTWRSTLSCARSSSVLDEVRAALDDDLNCPGAIRAVDDAAAAGVSVASGAALLGVTL